MSYAQTAKKHGHIFGEAFMLMQYQCESCGGLVKIWNSRDGVTPFSIPCTFKCKGDEHVLGKVPLMNHVAWQQDEYLPDYSPVSGEYVFVTTIGGLARALANSYVQHLSQDRRFTEEYRYEKRSAFRDKLIEDWTKNEEPALVRLP